MTPTYFDESSVVGGGERYVFNIIKSLRDCEVEKNTRIVQDVITVSDKEQQKKYDGIDIKILENIFCTEDKMSTIPGDLWQFISSYDLVHIHQGLTQFGSFCTAVASSLDKPIVLTDLGGGADRNMLEGKGVELVDRVVSISEYANSLLVGSYTGKSDVLIGPVDTDYFCPPAKKKDGDSYAICVGRMLPHKGVDRIISALPDGLSLKIVGNIYHEEYYHLLRKMAIGKDVEFIAGIDDSELLSLYQKASIFVQASTHKDIYGNSIHKPELMGLTTLEAMSCGVPAVVSNAGSLPELVPNETVGKVFSDTSQLNNIFEEFLAGDWPLPNSSILARNHIVDNFSFNKVGISLFNIYKDLILK